MKSTLTEVTYRRLFNLGNYESEAIELKADVDATETAEQVVAELRDQVKALHAKGGRG
jgi:hypothetical protein